MDLYRLFRSFLEERGCEKAFEEAFGNQHPGYVLDAVLWKIIGGDEFFLGRAFEWDGTPEGRQFWLKVDQEWGEVCRQIQFG
jgi:hypothetical protein